MSRRSSNSELAFGSDSFLDIVANIVGILIILIVVAGVRVSQSPIAILADTAVASTEPGEPASVPEPEIFAPDVPSSRNQAAATNQVRREELVARARALETQIAAIDADLTNSAADLKLAADLESDLQRRMSTASQDLIDAQQIAAGEKSRAAQLSLSLDQTKTELQRVQTQLAKVESTREPVEKLEHKLTPVSSKVKGKEIHFRLAQNRVSVVPIEELSQRLKQQIQRQKDWLTKFRRHQGSVGPVGGFTMNYVIERQQLSVMDELQHGRGIVRIAVSQWQIEPESDLEADTITAALRPNSAFARTLLAAENGATLTFWVYPDSFKLYRRLQKVAQHEGFTVAARPLPFSVPIAGSPSGSRSAGQ